MITIEQILNNFTQEDLFSCDNRKRLETLIGDFYSVVTMSPNVASPSDKEFAEWAIDKFVELEAIQCNS